MSKKLTKYKKLSKLGEGTYGVVYLAVNQRTQQKVAMKQIRLDFQDEGVPGTAIREIVTLKELANHPNIVKLEEVMYIQNRFYLVFEFVDYDLRAYLEKQEQQLAASTVKTLIRQLLEGVEYSHRHRIIHRDLKPCNLLVNAQGTLKIADFGLARAIGVPIRQYTHEVVTLWYRAPEILLGCEKYAFPVDIWSVGCIFFEIVTRRPLFPGDSEIDELHKIFQITGTPNDDTWPGVSELKDYQTTFPKWKKKSLAPRLKGLSPAGIDLLEKMLELNPADRISAKQALIHPYFSENV